MPSLSSRLAAPLLGALLVLTGCSAQPSGGSAVTSGADACGPATYAEVRGPRPSYADTRLSRFVGDAAMCAGWWLPGADAGFVAQGLVVGRRTAWVGGYDGSRSAGHRTCTVQRLSLRTGARLARTTVVRGGGVTCRHGGGLTRTHHGLWLVETHRLWLLDPRTLRVRRRWDVPAPVRGSFLVTGARGRLGIGGYRDGRPGRLFWFGARDALTRTRLTADAASSSVPTPANAQGAFLGRVGARQGLWFSLSGTRCGALAGPGAARAFLPGAEGLQARGGQVWVVSESASRGYYSSGDRPLVPMLARFDAAALTAGPAPTCTP